MDVVDPILGLSLSVLMGGGAQPSRKDDFTRLFLGGGGAGGVVRNLSRFRKKTIS